jgi:catechol 2,3-dioxygenase-like lactoylglutathione lyase family enzyme
MKRFHVHIRVDDIEKNIAFYSQLFSQKPDKIEQDYAKWIIDDPRLNFAISNHGEERGISHLGVEFENQAEFLALQQHQLRANLENQIFEKQSEQKHANCCYAQSQKHWLLDPQQVPWEIFHTFDKLEEYGFSDTKETIMENKSTNG